MMSCIRIILRTVPTGTPGFYLIGDELEFDGVNSLNLSKKSPQLEFGRINDEAVLGFNLPYTNKNDFILDKYKKVTIWEDEYDPIPVDVFIGSHRLNNDLLLVKFSDDIAKGYEVEIIRSADHPLQIAGKTKIVELDWTDFNFTKTNVESNQSTNDKYNDGDDGYYFPLLHFGAWTAENYVTIEDYRPVFHALKILQDGFCSGGWDFECPALETDWGRRIAYYICSEEYGQDEDLVIKRSFRAERTSSTNVYPGMTVTFNDDSTDPNFNGGRYETSTGHYQGAMEGDFYAEVEVQSVDMGTGNPDQYMTIEMEIVKDNGTIQKVIALDRVHFDEVETKILSARAQNISTGSDDKVYIRLKLINGDFAVITGGHFYNKVKKTGYVRGDVMKMDSVLHPDYTVLDIYKSISHIINGRTLIDWVNKKVTLYSAYAEEVGYDEESISSFYLANADAIDFTEKIIPNTKKVVTAQANMKRYFKLQFKDSSCKFIDSLDLDDQLYSREVDLGEDFEEGTEVVKDTFAEPTANEKAIGISAGEKFAPIIPHLWDNEDGKKSYKLAPRIFYCAGLVKQYSQAAFTYRWFYYEDEDTEENDIPLAYQYMPDILYDSGAIGEDNLIFGTEDKDLYRQFWEWEVKLKKHSRPVTMDAIVNVNDYFAWKFRDKYEIYDGHRTWFGRLEEIVDFDTCNNISTQLVFYPDPNRLMICDDEEGLPDECANSIDIDLSYTSSTNTITAVADDDLASTKDTDTWTYSTNGGSSWSAYTPGANVSSFNQIIFKRIVTFIDDCPDLTTVRTFNATVCNNNPKIDLTFDTSKKVAYAEAGGNVEYVNTDTWEYSVDGGAWSSYTPPTEVSGFSTVRFRRTTTYTNSCATSIVERQMNMPSEDELNENCCRGFRQLFDINQTYIDTISTNAVTITGGILPTDVSKITVHRTRARMLSERSDWTRTSDTVITFTGTFANFRAGEWVLVEY